MDKSTCNPFGLSPAEIPMYELFKKMEKREPESMGELMCWSASIQSVNKGSGACLSGIGSLIGGLW